jgi:hypothetical protein
MTDGGLWQRQGLQGSVGLRRSSQENVISPKGFIG